MKKLFMTCLLFCTLASHAGEAIDKSTGARLIFNLDRENKSVTITLKDSTDEQHKTISLLDYEKAQAYGVSRVRSKASLNSECGPCGAANGNPQILYRISHDVFEDTKETFNHVWVGYIVPGWNLLMISANLADTLLLPINLPRKMLRNSYPKKDLKVLNTLLNTDEVIEVNSRQFDRLFYYF